MLMWKYKGMDQWDTISLHDCRITTICAKDKDILLGFAEGYWIVETNPQNPYGKTLRTGEAELAFTGAKCEKVEVDDKEMLWGEFCQKINSENWEFECITEEFQEGKCVFWGWVWAKGNPIHQNCHLHFSFDHRIYHWNLILEDRPW